MKPEPAEAVRLRGRRDAGITIAGLRAFATVVEAGGFSAAALRLGLTQPSVSAQIQGLEEACGVRLLHRRGGRVLTEAGRALLVRARLVLTRFEEFERAVSDHRALRQGRVQVGFSAPAYAMPLLSRFAAAHPLVELATQIGNTGQLLAWLAECRIDLGVMSLAAPRPGFACALIATLRLGLCLRRDDPWAARQAVAVRCLAGAALIHREPGSMTRALLEEAVASLTPARLEVGSREALVEAVAAGLGRGYVFEDQIGGDERVVFVPLARPTVIGRVYAVALAEMAEAPAVAALLGLAGEGAA